MKFYKDLPDFVGERTKKSFQSALIASIKKGAAVTNQGNLERAIDSFFLSDEWEVKEN